MLNMKKEMTVIFLSACCMAGCVRQATTNDSTKIKASECAVTMVEGDIPYTVAEHYFVRNDLSALPPEKIVSENDFNANFGMAAIMGDNGMPTKIDFKRQYVISVTLPETNIHTEIVPVGLKKADDGKIIFSYQIKLGGKLTYTMVPSLLIIVDRKHDGKVVLDAVGNT